MKMVIVPEVLDRMSRSGRRDPAQPRAGGDRGRPVPASVAGKWGVVPKWGMSGRCWGGQVQHRSGSVSAPDSRCMTTRGPASAGTMLLLPSRPAIVGCSNAISTILLTFCNNAGRDFEIYLKRTFRSGWMQGGGMKVQIVRKMLHAVCLACLLCPVQVMAENSYVGTAACKDCHEVEYDNFTKFAKKAHSDKSIKIMASDLTEAELAECYACHTTGYGKPGGFVSYEKTPHVADAGCEVCHGPGRDHVESGGDASLIKGKLSMEDCTDCHNESRVKAFNFKPLLYGGAH